MLNMKYIRLSHTHEDGTKCFEERGFEKSWLAIINNKEVLIGYRSFTDHYYAYNMNGVEIATFKRDFFEEYIKHKAYNKPYNALAGYNRNGEIVANSDYIIAFWDGKSKGTGNTIYRANKAGINVKVIIST